MNPGLFNCADKHIPGGIESPDSGSPETGERARADGLQVDARVAFALNEDPLALLLLDAEQRSAVLRAIEREAEALEARQTPEQRAWYRRRQTRRFQGTLDGARELVALGYV
jgi:hypothetical protein